MWLQSFLLYLLLDLVVISTAVPLFNHVAVPNIISKLSSHDKILDALVHNTHECPSLVWFYPKKRTVSNWLSNPVETLYKDTVMLMFVCPETLATVECDPEGVGWEIKNAKQRVKKWATAILRSLRVMQAAIIAGRVLGIPLPVVPTAEDIGLSGMGGMFCNKYTSEAVTSSVNALWSTIVDFGVEGALD